jgi:hypothetical protein
MSDGAAAVMLAAWLVAIAGDHEGQKFKEALIQIKSRSEIKGPGH